MSKRMIGLMPFYLIFSLVARGQSTGNIAGTITDTTNTEQPGITVSIVQPVRSTVTGDNGDFSIRNLPAGSYELRVSGVGFVTTTEKVNVAAGKTSFVQLQLTLRPGNLSTVVVRSTARNAYTHNKLSSSSRLTTPVFELPQNIVVLGNKVFQDQQIFSPADVARNVSGVNTLFPYPGVYTDFNIRGIRATQAKFRNGMNTGVRSFGMLMEDLSYVESIEFVKGPATFLLGQGEPSGVFNVVTKKPVKEKLLNIQANAGSFNLWRGSLDAGGSLLKNGRISYRLNGAYQRNNTHIDFQENRRYSIAPALRFDITSKTTFIAEYTHDRFTTQGFDLAIPTTTNNRFSLPRNFSVVGPNIDDAVSKTQFVYTQLQHQFNANWKITAQAAYTDGDSKGYDITVRGRIFPGDSAVREARYIYNFYINRSAQLFVNGKFKTGKVLHELMAGFDAGSQYAKQPLNTAPNLSIRNLPGRFSLLNPNYTITQAFLDTFIRKENIRFNTPAVVRWNAVNIYHVIKLLPQLHINYALRYNWYEAGNTEILKDRVLTPRVGLSIFPHRNTNIYGLYDRTFLPVAGRDFAGNEFRPQDGRNVELGVKQRLFNNRLVATASAFEIVKNNALTGDPVNRGFQIQEGEITSRGIEFDINGSPVEGLQLTANYSYIDARFTADTANSKLIGRREQGPYHTANIWATYRIGKGTLKGLGFGAGYSYMGNRAVLTIGLTDAAQQQKIPDFRQLDAALYYQWKRLNLSFNLNNITSADNIYGTFDRRGGANVFNYLTTPGINWRLGVSYQVF